MRMIFILICLFLLYSFLYPSSFKLVVYDSTAEVVNGAAVDLKVDFINISAQTLYWQINRLTNEIPDNWSTAMCFGEICFAPFVSEIMFDINQNNAILPGDSAHFKITFNTDPDKSGAGEALVQFMDLFTEDKDSVLFKVTSNPSPLFQIRQVNFEEVTKPARSAELSSLLINLTDRPLDLVITRTVNDIPADWSTAICIGTSCYVPNLAVINESLPPNDSLELKISFNTGLLPDSGIVHLTIEEPLSGQTEEIIFKLYAKAQFLVFPGDTTGSGPLHSEIELGGYIHNFSDSTIQIKMIRLSNQIPQDWTTSLCLRENCLAPQIDQMIDSISAADSLYFSIHFYTGTEATMGEALLAFTAEGNSDTISQRFKVSSYATALEEAVTDLPLTFKLLTNYPNPFNQSTLIRFETPEALKSGSFKIYDLGGALIRSIVIEHLPAGLQYIHFKGIDEKNHFLPSGIYFYRIDLLGQSNQRYNGVGKFTLLK